ncbi:hypothetical protein [Streptomyces armeniacus]|uniref:hypothetical protein n=1 Tax=Streptomyces armeniacus TaxID=83291 RepID=UPI001AD800ED|nr:hypothetical protein [Streptomyces armeniacus]
MSTLQLLVLLLMVLVGASGAGGLAYLVHRHPRAGTPVLVAIGFTTVLIGAVALILTAR